MVVVDETSNAGDRTRDAVLRFLGGAGTVTGSKFHLVSGDTEVLVDCGLFQGLKELRLRNWDDPGVRIESLDCIVLTHAHLDHCGYLPRLVAAGYRGPVYATPGTAALAAIVLPDSGHLNEEEADHANRHGYSRHEPALPLYTEEDAWRAVDLIREIPYHVPTEIAPGMSVELSRAGHILGAATVSLMLDDIGTTVAFSGDLGRPEHPLLVAPDPAPACDVLLVESTYGDRRHDDEHVVDDLAAVIVSTVERGGSVLIPAFAVDRTEVLLVQLARLARAGRLPPVPVYVDSPMALSALQVYRAAIAAGDPAIRADLHRTDPFDVPGLEEVRDVEGSRALNHPAAPCVIVSASGMASGGRVVHHLASMLQDSRNSVVLAGFQAEGTRGRQLVDGATSVKMLGRYIPVRARVLNLRGFSVHADADELVDWVASAPSGPKDVFVVHGEPSASAALAGRLRSIVDGPCVVPRLGERVGVGPKQ